eukprot:11123182-Karenia_brevis.AAC.1
MDMYDADVDDDNDVNYDLNDDDDDDDDDWDAESFSDSLFFLRIEQRHGPEGPQNLKQQATHESQNITKF